MNNSRNIYSLHLICRSDKSFKTKKSLFWPILYLAEARANGRTNEQRQVSLSATWGSYFEETGNSCYSESGNAYCDRVASQYHCLDFGDLLETYFYQPRFENGAIIRDTMTDYLWNCLSEDEHTWVIVWSGWSGSTFEIFTFFNFKF